METIERDRYELQRPIDLPGRGTARPGPAQPGPAGPAPGIALLIMRIKGGDSWFDH